jgi:ABC-2 type transport system ATP-binding protein
LEPVRQRRRLASRIGVVFGQRSQLWWDLPLRESFSILAAIHRLEPAAARRRTDELVEQLEMAHTLDTPVRQLSLGQRMRAEIAAALLHRPELLILDEPTIGLDVLSKQRLREFLRRERADSGTTLLLTTHDMGDIERLCERVLVVDHGRLAYDGTLPGLARTVGARRVLVVDLARPSDDLTDLAGATLLAAEADGMRQRLAFDPEITTAAQLLAAISNRVEVRDLSIEEPDIEDVVRRIYSAGDGTAPAPSDAGAVARGAIPGDEAESAAERPGEQGVQNAAEGGAAGVEKAVQRGATGVDDDRNHASTSL